MKRNGKLKVGNQRHIVVYAECARPHLKKNNNTGMNPYTVQAEAAILHTVAGILFSLISMIIKYMIYASCYRIAAVSQAACRAAKIINFDG